MLGETGRVAVMGILNVTPDSFSDGGLYADPDIAVLRGLELWRQGADLVDVGGESTRPGAESVDAAEELRRVEPVVARLVEEGVAVSIDTGKASVARVALEAGALVVNDVTGLSDPEMIATVSERGSSLVIMHMPGDPRTMHLSADYGDVVGEVRGFLLLRARSAVAAGVDPGTDLHRSRHRLRKEPRPQPADPGSSRGNHVVRLPGDGGDLPQILPRPSARSARA